MKISEHLAEVLFSTVAEAQNLLSAWIVPDSNIKDEKILQDLLGVLDNSDLVRLMRTANEDFERFWITSKNIERTKYLAKAEILEVEYRTGNIYHYSEFPLELWKELFVCESIGSFLAQKVKGYFSYIQVNGD